MIATAREQAPAAGVAFVEGDLRDIDRLVEDGFGGALCLGNAVPHLRCKVDLDRFLSGLRNRLEPDAPLLMQLLNYQRIFDRGERYLPLNFRDDGEEEIIFLRLMDLRDNGEVIFYPSTLRLVPGAEPPLEVKAAKEVHLRGWRHLELIEALRGAGFARQDALGSFAGEAFDPQVSHDLILVAR
jgi:GNAT superfamily N-acetyltransferase